MLLASLDLPVCSETLEAGTAVTVSRAASLVVVAGLCTAGGAADLLLGVTTALTSSEPGLEEEEQQEAHDERPHFPLHLGQIIEGVSVNSLYQGTDSLGRVNLLNEFTVQFLGWGSQPCPCTLIFRNFYSRRSTF